jgi:drug/metabolite transporter (DMT)-like permease
MVGRRWLGLLLGISGVVVLFEPWRLTWSEPDVILGHILLILAAVTNAATSVHIRGHRWTMTPLQAVPWQLAGAAIILLVLAMTTEGIPQIDWTVQLGWIIAYQGLLASGTAFWAQIVILRNLAAVSANLTLMAVPVVGVVSSALLVGENVTFTLVSGLVLIITGVTMNLLTDDMSGMSTIAATEPESQS